MQRLGQHFKLITLSNVDHDSFNRTLDGPLCGCRFDAIYIAQDIGSYKPDLKNFRYLLEHVESEYNVEKDQLCHVAQSLFHDQGPAKQIDIQSVWVDRQDIIGSEPKNLQEQYGYQLRVESLSELADIVDRAFNEE